MPHLLDSRPDGAEGAFEACVRPERLSFTPAPDADARIIEQTFLGNIRRLRLSWRGRELIAETHQEVGAGPGEAVRISVAPEACAWVRT